VPIALAQGGNAINLQNAIRQGDLKTYGVQQQVQPVNYAVGPGTSMTAGIGKALGSIAGTLAGSAGPKVMGSMGSLGASAFGGAGYDFGSFDPAGAVGTPDFSNIDNYAFG
jgi:hypothetical protein